MMQASTNGITYFRRRSESFAFAPEACFFVSADARSCISFSSRSACSVLLERSKAAYAASLFPRLRSQRGDSDNNKLPITNRIPGGRDTQKIPRHAEFLNAKIALA